MRNIFQVVVDMQRAAPADSNVQKALVDFGAWLQKDCAYHAPEQMNSAWLGLTRIVNEHIRFPPKEEFHRVLEIYEGRPIAEILEGPMTEEKAQEIMKASSVKVSDEFKALAATFGPADPKTQAHRNAVKQAGFAVEFHSGGMTDEEALNVLKSDETKRLIDDN